MSISKRTYIYAAKIGEGVFDVDLPEEEFKRILDVVESNNMSWKRSQSRHRAYYADGLTFEIDVQDRKKEKVVAQKTLACIEFQENMPCIQLTVEREKVPYHAFPSASSALRYVNNVNRVTFIVSRSCELHVELSVHEGSETSQESKESEESEESKCVHRVYLTHEVDFDVTPVLHAIGVGVDVAPGVKPTPRTHSV